MDKEKMDRMMDRAWVISLRCVKWSAIVGVCGLAIDTAPALQWINVTPTQDTALFTLAMGLVLGGGFLLSGAHLPKHKGIMGRPPHVNLAGMAPRRRRRTQYRRVDIETI